MNGRRQHRLRTVLRGGVAITTLGIYGPRDSNAWLGKIVCDRPHKGHTRQRLRIDSLRRGQLGKSTSQLQTWQFFATAIGYYCPDQTSVLENVAAQWR
jgi:hypothetical protein